MKFLKLALWQAAPVQGHSAGHLQQLDSVMSATRADVVITPELCWPGYGDPARARALAMTRDDAFVADIRALAAHHRKALVIGYSETDEGRLFNSALCIGPDGDVLQNYRKQTTANDFERSCFGTGKGGSVFQLFGVPTAILICYDAEFPELVRRVARAGARLVVVPTALGAKWRVVSDIVVPTRAYENGIFMAYCNHAGGTADSAFCGLSVVAGPDGNAIARAGAEASLLEATLNLGQVDEVRGQLNFLGVLSTIAP